MLVYHTPITWCFHVWEWHHRPTWCLCCVHPLFNHPFKLASISHTDERHTHPTMSCTCNL